MKAAVLLTTTLGASAALAHGEALEQRWRADAVVFEVMDTDALVDRERVARALAAAAGAWNQVGTGPELSVGIASDDDSGSPVALDGRNRVGVLEDWPYPEQAGAVTLAWSEDGSDEILEVDIALNPRFPWGDRGGRFDLENVFAHEVGHALGLPDVKDLRDATMFYMILPGETLKRDLSTRDEAMLLKLYEGIEMDEQGGCNATGASAPALGLGLLTLLGARRRRNG